MVDLAFLALTLPKPSSPALMKYLTVDGSVPMRWEEQRHLVVGSDVKRFAFSGPSGPAAQNFRKSSFVAAGEFLGLAKVDARGRVT